MKRFELIFKWPSGHTITVYNSFRSWDEAFAWKRLCEDICGKDENGVRFTRSEIKLDRRS